VVDVHKYTHKASEEVKTIKEKMHVCEDKDNNAKIAILFPTLLELVLLKKQLHRI
jgi:hypothetical protein